MHADSPRQEIVSVELLLDSVAEACVRDEWMRLHAAGVSNMAAHTAPSNRPHLTLLVRTTLDAFDARGLVAALPVQVTLGAPLLFGAGDRRVLARSVVPNEPLLRLHAAVHAAAGAGDDAPLTRPGEWTPHVTLARRVRSADLPRALHAVAGTIDGRGVALRRWDARSKTVTALGLS